MNEYGALVECEMVGFRCCLPEFFRLLGSYASKVGLAPTFRDYVSVPFSRGPIRNLETSVLNQAKMRKIPQDGKNASGMILPRKNQSPGHFFHHKSHMTWRATEHTRGPGNASSHPPSYGTNQLVQRLY